MDAQADAAPDLTRSDTLQVYNVDYPGFSLLSNNSRRPSRCEYFGFRILNQPWP